MITDPCQTIKVFHIINDKLLLLEHQHNDYTIPTGNVGNIFLTTFTTSSARLYLYEIMEPLGWRVFIIIRTPSSSFTTQDCLTLH